MSETSTEALTPLLYHVSATTSAPIKDLVVYVNQLTALVNKLIARVNTLETDNAPLKQNQTPIPTFASILSIETENNRPAPLSPSNIVLLSQVNREQQQVTRIQNQIVISGVAAV